MFKKIITIIVTILLLALMAGCSSSGKTETTTTSSLKSVREAAIGSTWVVKQVEITEGAEFSMVIKLTEVGSKVDGYFYIEKGNDIDFQISGNSVIYESQPVDAKTGVVTSDRFSFTSTQGQGIAYTLTFKSTAPSADKATKQTIFLEIIYPTTGTVYIPIGTK